MSTVNRLWRRMEWKGSPGVVAFLFLGPTGLWAQEGVAPALDEGSSFWGRALIVLAIALVFFVLTLVGAGIYFVARARKLVDKSLRPDLPKLIQAAEKLRQSGCGEAEITNKLIHREAVRAGAVGLLTGVGGLPTLPLTVPLDLLVTLRLQANMVRLIGLVHGAGSNSKEISDMGLWVVTAGSQQVTAASGAVLRKFLVKGLSRSALKVFPLLGGVIGFALNWSSTQAIGRMATRHYTGDWQISGVSGVRDALSGAAAKAQSVAVRAGRAVATRRRPANPPPIPETPNPLVVPPPPPSIPWPAQEVSEELLSQQPLGSSQKTNARRLPG